jgi:hypothetical protein
MVLRKNKPKTRPSISKNWIPPNTVARDSFSQMQEIKKLRPIMAWILQHAIAMKNRIDAI